MLEENCKLQVLDNSVSQDLSHGVGHHCGRASGHRRQPSVVEKVNVADVRSPLLGGKRGQAARAQHRAVDDAEQETQSPKHRSRRRCVVM